MLVHGENKKERRLGQIRFAFCRFFQQRDKTTIVTNKQISERGGRVVEMRDSEEEAGVDRFVSLPAHRIVYSIVV